MAVFQIRIHGCEGCLRPAATKDACTHPSAGGWNLSTCGTIHDHLWILNSKDVEMDSRCVQFAMIDTMSSAFLSTKLARGLSHLGPSPMLPVWFHPCTL
ncbi:hypothetical protein Mapa_006988 [Marchantia paleacea]|nr:hypothetical protein Mapa_006988 [Marchantia paleacea]